MRSTFSRTAIRRAAAAVFALLILAPACFAQNPAAAPLLSADQLNVLVGPVALYPDPLLSQVLAASTYPLEIIEAQQWLAQNGNLQGAQLMDAAKGQDWDPSVQALVAFPDALKLLANDIRWTTDLGNAFLAQQADVMIAVQRMRASARSNGRLNTTPQQVVRMDTQNGQNEIEIQPADQQVIYVPVYSPYYVWGPPLWGAYYDMWYPSGFGWGFGFGPGIYMSAFYPGWGGWGGWGWGCGWFGRSLFLNPVFFGRYGFHGGYYGRYGGSYGGGYEGRAGWTHDPHHRLGAPYPNQTVASRFGGDRMNRGQFAGGARTNGMRSAPSGAWPHFGGGNRPPSAGQPAVRGSSPAYRQSSPGYSTNGAPRSNRAPAQGYRSSPSPSRSYAPGYSAQRSGGYSAPRTYSAPSRSYSAPQAFSSPRVYSGGGASAPRSYSAPSRSFSAPRSSGGGGGSSGGRSSGGGGGGRRR